MLQHTPTHYNILYRFPTLMHVYIGTYIHIYNIYIYTKFSRNHRRRNNAATFRIKYYKVESSGRNFLPEFPTEFCALQSNWSGQFAHKVAFVGETGISTSNSRSISSTRFHSARREACASIRARDQATGEEATRSVAPMCTPKPF